MDLTDAMWLVAECALIGFGMALGDFLLKATAVKLMNTHIITLTDSDEPEEVFDEEEEPVAKKARKRPPKS